MEDKLACQYIQVFPPLLEVEEVVGSIALEEEAYKLSGEEVDTFVVVADTLGVVAGTSEVVAGRLCSLNSS